MRGPQPQTVILRARQIDVIQTILRQGTSEQRVVRRARTVVLASEGLYPFQIAEKLDCHPSTVWRICERFREDGVQAFYDRPRSGAPRRISPPRPHSDSGSGLRAAR